MSRAICASLSGDQGMASSFLNQAARRGVARGIDFHLAEKVVGAGFNSRRSVNIEWTGVDKLTAWRFGMATATAVEIPENLWEGVDRHVRAWQARAVLLPMASRLAATTIAARLGVFTNEALVEFYSRFVEGERAPEDSTEQDQANAQAYDRNHDAPR